MKDLLGELTEQGADPDALRSPDEIKRDAIKKVTEVNRRLDELLSGEKGKSAEALRQALSQLDTPKEGMAREFAEALAKGDFSSARQALEKMLEQLAEGNVPAEAQEQLAEQLQQLANQLQQLAQQQQQLQQALQQAGLDPQLANNPQALQQALKNNPNLNQQQVQQLQQLVQAQQAARQMCQGLGQACQNMAQAMQGNQGQGMGQGLADQLNQMEQLQMMLQQAQAAANACAGMCQGLGQGLSEKPGPGMGNRGVGEGGRAPRAPTPWGTQLRKADVTTDPEGEIIARMLIDGPEYIGESRKAARRIVTELLDGYDQAIAEELVPPQYKSAHQHYFGELKKRTEARLAEDKDAATGQPAAADPAPADAPQTPAPAPAPAEPAKGGA
jgi:chemotaxis protein histidine kinase CheA